MIEPKFKIGQTVYGQSDWFAGSYMPDCYTIRRNEIAMINGKEVVLCYVKHRRIPMLEDMLFPTEEEAQMQEVRRFRDNTEKILGLIKEQLENEGIDDKEQALLENADSLDASHRFSVGDVAYGHMDGYGYEYKPEKFVITSCDVEVNHGIEHNIYKVKGHGGRFAYEEYLYPTYKEALIADLNRFKATLKGEVKSIETRAKSLGIENQVKALLLSRNGVKMLE